MKNKLTMLLLVLGCSAGFAQDDTISKGKKTTVVTKTETTIIKKSRPNDTITTVQTRRIEEADAPLPPAPLTPVPSPSTMPPPKMTPEMAPK